MLAFWRKRGISECRNRGLKIWLSREVSVFGFVECALDIVDLVADVNASTKGKRITVAERRKFRQARQCEIDFCDRPVSAIVLHFLHEVRREMHWISQFEQRAFRIGIGDDGFREYFFARG